MQIQPLVEALQLNEPELTTSNCENQLAN